MSDLSLSDLRHRFYGRPDEELATLRAWAADEGIDDAATRSLADLEYAWLRAESVLEDADRRSVTDLYHERWGSPDAERATLAEHVSQAQTFADVVGGGGGGAAGIVLAWTNPSDLTSPEEDQRAWWLASEFDIAAEIAKADALTFDYAAVGAGLLVPSVNNTATGSAADDLPAGTLPDVAILAQKPGTAVRLELLKSRPTTASSGGVSSRLVFSAGFAPITGERAVNTVHTMLTTGWGWTGSTILDDPSPYVFRGHYSGSTPSTDADRLSVGIREEDQRLGWWGYFLNGNAYTADGDEILTNLITWLLG